MVVEIVNLTTSKNSNVVKGIVDENMVILKIPKFYHDVSNQFVGNNSLIYVYEEFDARALDLKSIYEKDNKIYIEIDTEKLNVDNILFGIDKSKFYCYEIYNKFYIFCISNNLKEFRETSELLPEISDFEILTKLLILIESKYDNIIENIADSQFYLANVYTIELLIIFLSIFKEKSNSVYDFNPVITYNREFNNYYNSIMLELVEQLLEKCIVNEFMKVRVRDTIMNRYVNMFNIIDNILELRYDVMIDIIKEALDNNKINFEKMDIDIETLPNFKKYKEILDAERYI